MLVIVDEIMNYFELHKISETSLNVFTRLSGLAEERNVKIYVVGGFVRDLLLNHEVEDIDIVVEGDAIAFAHDFKKKNGGSKVVSYGQQRLVAYVSLFICAHIHGAKKFSIFLERT